MNSNDSIPTTYDFNFGMSYPTDNRITEQKTAGDFGLRGFVGVEYFVIPKISVGGEFGLGFMYSKVGEGYVNTESWN